MTIECPIMPTENPPPEDLAGYQHIVCGIIQPGDIIVGKLTREKRWAKCMVTWDITPSLDEYDVYRKMACPKAGDHDKGWQEVRKSVDADKNNSPFMTGEEFMHKFSTGSIRQSKAGKGRFDLLPYEPIRQLAVHYEEGGKGHGDRNWELGQPLSTFINSAKRHAAQAGCKFDENHAIAACWNFFGLIQTAKWIEEGKLPRELDDIGWLDSNKPKTK